MVLTVVGVTACQPAAAPTHATVSLRLHGGPAAATVLIDEETVGTLDFVEARGVALPVGEHHVTISADGYFPWDRAIDAKAGAPPIRLEVQMTAVPD
jgi:hypothetical protein